MLSYFAVNPGGEFLSLADVPYKTLYFVTPIWWAALTVFWLLNWVRYRNFNVRYDRMACFVVPPSRSLHRATRSLQRVMTLVPFFECVLALCLHFYWDHLSRQGAGARCAPPCVRALTPCLAGTESAQLALAVLLVRAVGDFIFFLCLMLAAHGWAITLDGLDWRQWRKCVPSARRLVRRGSSPPLHALPAACWRSRCCSPCPCRSSPTLPQWRSSCCFSPPSWWCATM